MPEVATPTAAPTSTSTPATIEGGASGIEQAAAPAVEMVTVKIGRDQTIQVPKDEYDAAARQFLAGENRLKSAKEYEAKIRSEREADRQRLALVDQFLGDFKKGDRKFIAKAFKDLGLDFDEIAFNHSTELLDYQSASPEQRKIIDERRRLAELEEQNKTLMTKQEQAQAAQLKQMFDNVLVTTIPAAIKEAGLPEDPSIVYNIAAVYQQALAANQFQEPRSTEEIQYQLRQVAKYVKKERDARLKSEFESLSEDDLIARLGDKAQKLAKKLTPADPVRKPRATPQTLGKAKPKTDLVGFDERRRQRERGL